MSAQLIAWFGRCLAVDPSGGSLRGAGDTRFPLLAVLTGLVGVRVALASLFAWLGLPVGWIYGALIGDYVVKASMLTTRFVRGRWKTIRV